MDIEAIRQKLEYYRKDLYAGVRQAQHEDEEYYKDTFKVPWVKPPLIVSRTGAGAEMIDSPVSQLASAVLKVTRPPIKDTASAKNSAVNLTKSLNYGLNQILKQNPNPKLEHYKNQLLRGEAWIQVIHNQGWAQGNNLRGLPYHFLLRDPLIIFASPNEDQNGIPEEVFVFHERMPWVVKALYPSWTNPLGRGGNSDSTNTVWMEYWTPQYRYFEADSEPVLPSDENPYGIVPFIHKVASFGKGSDAGRMEDLIVGRLRKYRDLLKRDAAITSDIDSIYHLYANPSTEVQPNTPDATVPENFKDKYVFGPGYINELPYGITVRKGIDQAPSPEALQWSYKISSDLGRKVPGALLGLPAGASGRLQDMTYGAAMAAYTVEIANLEDAFATAFGIALKIMYEWPGNTLIPEGVKKEDIAGNYDVKVELKSEDPIEQDRKVMAGRTMVAGGLRSLRTFLIKDCGMTDDEAEEEIEEILAEKYMFQSADIAELLQLRAAEKSGMAADIQAIRARRQELEKKVSQFPLGSQIGSQGGEPRTGNIQSQTGQEMSDIAMTQGGIRQTALR